jgi:hypothetical protein
MLNMSDNRPQPLKAEFLGLKQKSMQKRESQTIGKAEPKAKRTGNTRSIKP